MVAGMWREPKVDHKRVGPFNYCTTTAWLEDPILAVSTRVLELLHGI
jgi:hypothetical protein